MKKTHGEKRELKKQRAKGESGKIQHSDFARRGFAKVITKEGPEA